MGYADSSSLVYTNDQCIGCNKCINACPAMGACMSVDEMAGYGRKIVVNADYCVACGAIYMRKVLGIKDKLAFISPCIAKKMEIEDPNNAGLVQYNVAFTHLMDYVKENNIYGPDATDEIEYGLGSIYPTPSGLKENVYWFLGEDVAVRQIEGEKRLYEWLQNNKDRIKGGKTPFVFIDALNCENGCLCGTAVDPKMSETDDALYNILKIKENSKKNKKGDAWSRPDTPQKRLANLNKQFKNLRLEDYLRKYTDRSSKASYKEPTEKQRNEIFDLYGKNDQRVKRNRLYLLWI
ncbi:MAG: 4Fe-4S dicluster domain-containing protein [Lachnospiraceae bacterium]|nr:4Fe-4S dicluster domain-containing protein [Lachnospiraceae bacterium]